MLTLVKNPDLTLWGSNANSAIPEGFCLIGSKPFSKSGLIAFNLLAIESISLLGFPPSKLPGRDSSTPLPWIFFKVPTGAAANGVAEAEGVAEANGVADANGVAEAEGVAEANGVADAEGVAEANGVVVASGVTAADGVVVAAGVVVAWGVVVVPHPTTVLSSSRQTISPVFRSVILQFL